MRITNNTNETFILEPGESVDIVAEKDTIRTMSSRLEEVEIKEVREK